MCYEIMFVLLITFRYKLFFGQVTKGLKSKVLNCYKRESYSPIGRGRKQVMTPTSDLPEALNITTAKDLSVPDNCPLTFHQTISQRGRGSPS